MGKDRTLKKLARTLLATTCLTAAGSASGATFLEATFGGGDFSNNLNSPSVLAQTYDQVSGTLETPCCTDVADYFQIPGLTVGASYLLTFTTGNVPQLTLYDGLTPLSGPYSNGASVNITVPDSNLVFGINNAEGAAAWTVGFTSSAPEPGTLALAATALASTLAMRRRKKS